MAQVTARRRGLRFDPDSLDRELTARGLEGQDLAKLAGISTDTVSRLRHGARGDRKTMLKIVAALDAVPTNPTLARLVGV